MEIETTQDDEVEEATITKIKLTKTLHQIKEVENLQEEEVKWE